jgi:hypothetical protein
MRRIEHERPPSEDEEEVGRPGLAQGQAQEESRLGDERGDEDQGRHQPADARFEVADAHGRADRRHEVSHVPGPRRPRELEARRREVHLGDDGARDAEAREERLELAGVGLEDPRHEERVADAGQPGHREPAVVVAAAIGEVDDQVQVPRQQRDAEGGGRGERVEGALRDEGAASVELRRQARDGVEPPALRPGVFDVELQIERAVARGARRHAPGVRPPRAVPRRVRPVERLRGRAVDAQRDVRGEVRDHQRERAVVELRREGGRGPERVPRRLLRQALVEVRR